MIWNKCKVDNDVKRNYRNIDKRENITMNLVRVQKQIRKIAKCKANGPGKVHGYLINGFTSLHGMTAEQLNKEVK